MIIWLTGGSGGGKSMVAARFGEKGYKIIDADKIAREIVMPQKGAYLEIKAFFGADFLLPDGSLDRKKLGKEVFANKEKLAVLNSITHKYIIKEMEEGAKGEKNVVFDAPLRNTFGVFTHKTLYVTAPPETRAKRIMARDGIDRETAFSRIGAQSKEEEYLRDADAVILNDGNLASLYEKADVYIKEWYTN